MRLPSVAGNRTFRTTCTAAPAVSTVPLGRGLMIGWLAMDKTQAVVQLRRRGLPTGLDGIHPPYDGNNRRTQSHRRPLSLLFSAFGLASRSPYLTVLSLRPHFFLILSIARQQRHLLNGPCAAPELHS